MLLPAAVRRNGSPPAPEFPTSETPGTCPGVAPLFERKIMLLYRS